MADWNTPDVATAADTVLTELLARDVDALTHGYTAITNPPTHAIRWNRGSNKFEEYDGAAWNVISSTIAASAVVSGALALARGGTAVDLSASGSSTAFLAQDTSHVISARSLIAADIPNISAAKLTSGITAQARLGTGSDGTGDHFLADDQTYKVNGRKLIYSDSGTDTNASATNFATFALASTLGQKDGIHAVMRLSSQVAATLPPSLYNVTDSVTLRATNNNVGNTGTGAMNIYEFFAYCDPFSVNKVICYSKSFDAGNDLACQVARSTFVTPWTGAWTAGFRHGGVIAGGTLYWSVSLYKLAG